MSRNFWLVGITKHTGYEIATVIAGCFCTEYEMMNAMAEVITWGRFCRKRWGQSKCRLFDWTEENRNWTASLTGYPEDRRTCLRTDCKAASVEKSRMRYLLTATSRASSWRSDTWHRRTSRSRRPTISSVVSSRFNTEFISSIRDRPAPSTQPSPSSSSKTCEVPATYKKHKRCVERRKPWSR